MRIRSLYPGTIVIPPIKMGDEKVIIKEGQEVNIQSHTYAAIRDSQYGKSIEIISYDKEDPIELEVNSGVGTEIVPTKAEVPLPSEDYFEIVIISENCHFYSGGRYYMWMFAHALAEAGFKVAFFTNMDPVFKKDFKQYQNFKVFHGDVRTCELRGACYIGSPIFGNMRAVELAKQHGVQAFGFVFDPLPQLQEYVSEDYEMEYNYFSPMVPSLRRSGVKILCLTEFGKESIVRWLRKKPEEVHVVYPRINSRVSNRKRIVALSRVVGRKNFADVLYVLSKLPEEYYLDVITSTDYDELNRLAVFMQLEDRITINHTLSDRQKFKLIKSADVMLNTTKFEGFGMWMTEALIMGVPVVCYDFPTFREIERVSQTNQVFFAKRNNVDGLVEEILKVTNGKSNTDVRFGGDKWKFENMVEDVKRIFNPYRLRKIGWIADFFVEDHPGGAQQTNEIMIREGVKYGFIVEKIRTTELYKYNLDDYSLLIVNNIRLLPLEMREEIWNRKYVRYEHDYLHEFMAVDVAQKFFDHAQLNIFLSPMHYQEHLDKGYKIGKYHLQPSPVFAEDFYSGNKKRNGKVICVGEISTHKGIDDVLEFARSNPTTMIDFYGWVGVREGTRLLEEINSLPNCNFIGKVSHENLKHLYRDYSAFIHFPQWKEPFGRSVVEAYLSGCKLILNDNVGVKSYGWDFKDRLYVVNELNKAPRIFWEKIREMSN